MQSISSIELFTILKSKIGEQEAKSLTEYIEVQVKESFANEKEHLASKKDLAELKADLLKWLIVLFIPFYIGMIVFLIKNFV
jgi:hypothetical protein